MTIWFSDPPPAIEELNALLQDTLATHTGIRITEVGDDYLRGTMPVDKRTHQPFGILHGGASVALAETLGSIGGQLSIDSSRQRMVGLEINANHVRSMSSGTVTGTARPMHRGRSTHVWGIELHDEGGRLISVSRLTLAVLTL